MIWKAPKLAHGLSRNFEARGGARPGKGALNRADARLQLARVEGLRGEGRDAGVHAVLRVQQQRRQPCAATRPPTPQQARAEPGTPSLLPDARFSLTMRASQACAHEERSSQRPPCSYTGQTGAPATGDSYPQDAVRDQRRTRYTPNQACEGRLPVNVACCAHIAGVSKLETTCRLSIVGVRVQGY